MKILSVLQNKGLWIFSLCKLIQCMELEDFPGLTTIGSDKIGSNKSLMAGSNSVSGTLEQGKNIKTDSFSSDFNEIKDDDENQESMDSEATSSSLSRPFRTTPSFFESTEEEKRIADGLKPIRHFSKQFSEIKIDQERSIKNDYDFIQKIMKKWHSDFNKTKAIILVKRIPWHSQDQVSETYELLLDFIESIPPKNIFGRYNCFDVRSGEISYENAVNRLSPFQIAAIYKEFASKKIYTPTNLPHIKKSRRDMKITLDQLQSFLAGYMKKLLSFKGVWIPYDGCTKIDIKNEGKRRDFELKRIIIHVIDYMLKYKIIKGNHFNKHFENKETLDICATTMVMNYIIQHGNLFISDIDKWYQYPSSKLMPGIGEFSDFRIFTDVLSKKGQMMFSHRSLATSISNIYLNLHHLLEIEECLKKFSYWHIVEVLQDLQKGRIEKENSLIQGLDKAYQKLIMLFLSEDMSHVEQLGQGARVLAYFMLQFLHENIGNGKEIFEIQNEQIKNELQNKLKSSASIFEFLAETNNISTYMKSYFLHDIYLNKPDYWTLKSEPKARYRHAEKVLPCIEEYAENLKRKYHGTISESMDHPHYFFLNRVIKDSTEHYQKILQEAKKEFLPSW